MPPAIVKHDVIDQPPVKPVETTRGTETGTTVDVDTGGADVGKGTEVTTVVVRPIEIFNNSEVMPQYEGGVKAMIRFISRNTNYPAPARALDQEGTVYVRFVVNSLGQVVDVEVIKGVSAVLDKEAMRVIAMMSKWKPGLQHNLPVNVRMVLPIKFELEQ